MGRRPRDRKWRMEVDNAIFFRVICLTRVCTSFTTSRLLTENTMPKPLPITDEIQQIKARLRELQNQQLEELRSRRRELADELATVERQIADITGTPVQQAAAPAADGQGPRKRAPKLPKLVKDSEEYKEILRNVQTTLAKTPTGLNGKQVADALGFQQMNERNRIKELLNDNRFFKKTGQGVSTKFFLR